MAGQAVARERAAAPSVANPTTLRKRQAEPAESAVATSPRRRGIRPRTAALVAGAVLAIAVVAGVLFAAGGDGTDRPNDALPSTEPTDQTEAPQSVATPQVNATYTRASRTLVFSWTVSGVKPTDRFVWARAEDDIFDSRPVTVRTASLVTSDPAATCINVAYLPTGQKDLTNVVKKCGPAR